MFPKYPLRIILHFVKLKIQETLNPGQFLSEDNIESNPFTQFKKWFDEAKKSRDAFYDAMTLSTANKEGKPSARKVLLKGYDENGFVFFGNSNSKKGKCMAENPYAALTFFWTKSGKQVRIEGEIINISDTDADEYFATRPRRSQLGAWASEQSSVIPNREKLMEEMADLEKAYQGKEVPRPKNWLGYRVVPSNIEFWQNRSNRLHDRFLFTRENENAWKIERLAP